MSIIRDPFGLPDSESEIQLLKSDYANLFFDSNFSGAALRPETYLIVGRRGSGKTAIIQYFSFQSILRNPILVQVDQPYAYSEMLPEIVDRESGPRHLLISRLRQMWEHVLWSVIFEHTKNESSDIAQACDLPSANRNTSHLVRTIWERLYNSYGSQARDSIFQPLPSERFERAREALLQVAARRPIILAIDTLEKYDTNDDGMMSMTAALIEWAAEFNSRYRSRGLHVKLFLSGELFTHLVEEVLSNPLKSVRNPLHLLWRPRDLLRLISWRLYRTLEAHSLLPAEVKKRIDWDDPEDVTEKVWRPCFGWEISNTQGFQERTFSYVLRHTQMRPRQVITLCNSIANRAIRRGTFPQILEQDILHGVEEGQDNLAAEVINSFSGIYPQASRIIDALANIPMLVTGAELDKRAKYTNSAWPSGTYSLARFRNLLTELGIVGLVRRRNERDGYVDAVFEYSLPTRLTVAPQDECVIHPMFYSRLKVPPEKLYRVMPFGKDREADEAEGGSRLYKRDIKSFLRLSRRAESADRSKLVDTFVNVGPLATLLSTRDHQIIYGRRGTGKTHALLYLDSIVRSRRDVSAYIDLRTIGSTSSLYSNPAVPLAERATRLLMDVLGALHSVFYEQILLTQGAKLEKLGPLMDKFADAITEVVVTGSIQTELSVSRSQEEKALGSADISVSNSISAGIRAETTRAQSGQASAHVTQSGVAQHRVNFGRVGSSLRDIITAVAPRRIWVLLDEWSVVPMELQPLLADLIRRSLFPLSGVTVKIGSIEQRTHLQLPGLGGDYIGIEIGADAAADINLDDFMVYENHPENATKFFLQLIFQHVRSIQEDVEPAARFQVAQEILRGFTQRSVFEELVRAAEGVPRDAINILSLAAQRAQESAISMEDVRAAAKTWYQRDKEAAASANGKAKNLLNWIVDEVIGHRRTRGFLLRCEEKHSLIDALFDARVLHIVRRDISAYDQAGVRYDAYKIDYGCYVDLLTSPRGPRGLFLAGEGDGARYLDVPPDDYRAIRRAILDLRSFEVATD